MCWAPRVDNFCLDLSPPGPYILGEARKKNIDSVENPKHKNCRCLGWIQHVFCCCRFCFFCTAIYIFVFGGNHVFFTDLSHLMPAWITACLWDSLKPEDFSPTSENRALFAMVTSPQATAKMFSVIVLPDVPVCQSCLLFGLRLMLVCIRLNCFARDRLVFWLSFIEKHVFHVIWTMRWACFCINIASGAKANLGPQCL